MPVEVAAPPANDYGTLAPPPPQVTDVPAEDSDEDYIPVRNTRRRRRRN